MPSKNGRLERQRTYNRRSRQKKELRRMMLERSAPLLEARTPSDARYGRILHQLARAGDTGALRLFAICTDVMDAGADLGMDTAAVEMIAAAHDY